MRAKIGICGADFYFDQHNVFLLGKKKFFNESDFKESKTYCQFLKIFLYCENNSYKKKDKNAGFNGNYFRVAKKRKNSSSNGLHTGIGIKTALGMGAVQTKLKFNHS